MGRSGNRFANINGMTGGWETWQWDDTLFEGAAPFYLKGRFPYAPGIPDALADALALDATGRLLDLGCGPGVITLQLAHLFDEAVGLDPDADMLREAELSAGARGVSNATWVNLRAEELSVALGTFRVVTLAASFHWMDRPRVATAIKDVLTANGAVVQVDAPGRRPDAPITDGGPLQHPEVPSGAIKQLTKRYLGPDTRAGQGIRNSSPSGEDAVFRAAGFMPAQRVVVPDGRVLERTIDDEIAMVFSSSGSAPHLFGARIDAFQRDLGALLFEASPSGLFSVRLPDNTLDIWKVARNT
jgi:SAM-dependent methyltransferase